ncbi:MAG: glycosyltransferase family 4 protein [Clostridiales bacterium]|nr:glycosyltransferase family 4 protein [Clostridiales bacterium]
MKILWTVNLIPRPAAEELGIKSDVLGGWVESMAGQLRTFDGLKLVIACKSDTGLDFTAQRDGVSYRAIPYRRNVSVGDLMPVCEKLIKEERPDLIHIEGTEFPHAGAMLKAAKNAGVPAVVSMQGILNGQYGYQCGLLPIDDMLLSASPVKVFSALTLHLRKTRWYAPRMKPERELIANAEYILGRTTWDRAHTYTLNPDARYYSCPRVLRPPFYELKWDINAVERHSLYVGNSYYALKGFHFLVQALPGLIRDYPDLKVYVAGHKPFGDKRSLLKKGYGAYLKYLIDSLGVGEHIVFTGTLTADEVAKRLSTVNAYVLTSVAENSPNTLGEAMLVGAPCVSSYVGGAPDMAVDGEEALFYRSDDPAMLAWRIKQIFDDDALAVRLSQNAGMKAARTHDAANNARTLYNVYLDILKR